MTDLLGRSSLHYAVLDNDIGQVCSLLAGGADPNAMDTDGFQPLHFAAQQGAVEIARLLLDAGASVDPTNVYGNTPLFVAVFDSLGDGAVIGLLRARGADPVAANESGQTPVGLSRLISNYPVAQFFADLD